VAIFYVGLGLRSIWPYRRSSQAELGRNAAENYCLQLAVYACGFRELEYLTILLCAV